MKQAISDSECQIRTCAFERGVYRLVLSLRHLLQVAGYLCSYSLRAGQSVDRNQLAAGYSELVET
jgi:hypothetical protein